MKILSPNCMLCSERSTIEVDRKAYTAWQNGAMAQDAFPTWTADQRELLMTGTHPECWDDIMGDDTLG